MASRHWNREELLLTFNLYCRTTFGRLHKNNPEIILLASKIGRTPSAVAMKLVNFASFDPVHQARKVRGLSNASKADRLIWDEFNGNPERLAYESQQIFQQVIDKRLESVESEFEWPLGPTEKTRLVRTRLVQKFFHDTVLASYDYHCTICELGLLELLNASHIIPWSKNVERRADPRNGLALCVLHDRAFDRGLLAISDSFTVLISRKAKEQNSSRLHRVSLIEIEGKSISMPKRFTPDRIALTYHRKHIFRE
jgi:predicted restriction endonuclease